MLLTYSLCQQSLTPVPPVCTICHHLNYYYFFIFLLCFTKCNWEDSEGCDTFCKQAREVKADLLSTFCNYHLFLEELMALKVGELSEMH